MMMLLLDVSLNICHFFQWVGPVENWFSHAELRILVDQSDSVIDHIKNL